MNEFDFEETTIEEEQPIELEPFYNCEEWRDIKGFIGLYQVSNFGRVRSLDRLVRNKHSRRLIKGQILKPNIWGAGYLYVWLNKEQKKKSKSVHRLVAENFIPNIDNKPEVNHKDGNKQNNHVDNLEWVTSSENEQHAWNIGLISIPENLQIKCTDLLSGISKLFASCDQASYSLGYKKGTVSAALKRRGINGKVHLGNYLIERVG